MKLLAMILRTTGRRASAHFPAVRWCCCAGGARQIDRRRCGIPSFGIGMMAVQRLSTIRRDKPSLAAGNDVAWLQQRHVGGFSGVTRMALLIPLVTSYWRCPSPAPPCL